MNVRLPVSEMSPSDIADVLDSAAGYVRRVEWIQGDYYRPDGDLSGCPVDAIGAINVALFGQPFPPDGVHAHGAPGDIGDMVLQHLGLSGVDLETWNDEPSRSRDEVVAAFAGAAAELRGGAR